MKSKSEEIVELSNDPVTRHGELIKLFTEQAWELTEHVDDSPASDHVMVVVIGAIAELQIQVEKMQNEVRALLMSQG
jgi:hypothetical protein